ncbi:MAG: hypothetical protein FD141_132 [Fusobacteria bacterium]|nr:MAG: hypothetical protein FD141_132 [Fusobacteriota bacterium]KAF0229204.1 MAG: hypothetical protein FD182_1460 [Fusobacteriota bacterium]
MYIVSACLAGIKCRYDGKSSENEFVMRLIKEDKAFAVCPELLGGLKTPRPACEVTIDTDGNRKVVTKDGKGYTKEFEEGARKTLEFAKKKGINKAILKSKSPSCGCGLIHDGSFTGALTRGDGLTAELLIKAGLEVYTDKQLEENLNKKI